ncbi:MAG: hypothetical protein EOO70_09425 [Myxococcaceae bacterium]|nr:MAG: hypothetical protein EOO70_09425 [Myxococcaceae bacterium]
MANPSLSRTTRPASPDIREPVETIKRERTMKLAGVLAGMGLLVGGLFAVPFLDFRQGFDPGPTEAAYAPERNSDQAADTAPGTVDQAPAMQRDATNVEQAAPMDNQANPMDNGERGAPDTGSPGTAQPAQ